MKKLDLYIISRFLGTFVYSLVLIIGISMIFDFSEKIDDFIEENTPTEAIVFDYYLNFIPYFANLFSALFTFISVIFFTSKMAGNTEIVAILSSGVSYHRLLVPYMVAATVIALGSFALNNYVIPPANAVRLEFENTYISHYHNSERDMHKQVAPGVNVYLGSYNTMNHMGFQFTMEKVVDGELVSKLVADYIKWDSTNQKWLLNNYYIREFSADSMSVQVSTGNVIDSALMIHPLDFSRRDNIVESMTGDKLDEFIEREEMRGNPNINAYYVEKYKRVAFPFSTYILTIMGLSVASAKRRRGAGANIGLGIGLSFTYIFFMQITTQFSIKGGLDPLLAVWLPNFAYAIIAAILYRRAPK